RVCRDAVCCSAISGFSCHRLLIRVLKRPPEQDTYQIRLVIRGTMQVGYGFGGTSGQLASLRQASPHCGNLLTAQHRLGLMDAVRGWSDTTDRDTHVLDSR